MRLIDADELKQKYIKMNSNGIDEHIYGTNSTVLQCAIQVLDDMPTVEQKHGHWIYKQLDNYKKYSVTCSVCGAEYIDNYDGYITAENFNGCPNCLAKMDEV